MKRFSYFVLGLGLFASLSPAWAARKDFKGLFGSYKRERFVENEARDSDWGIDLGLSTLLPMGDVVRSSVDPTRQDAGTPLYYSTFFNVEASVLFSLGYNWQFYGMLGNFSYETRHENPGTANTNQPIFHMAELRANPFLLGVRYRFSTEDIVPYIGAGAGISLVHRQAFYDNDVTLRGEDNKSAVTGQVQAGVEFYVAPRAGIRLEVSGLYLKLDAYKYDSLGTPSQKPIILFQPNLLTMRYSSSLFYLF